MALGPLGTAAGPPASNRCARCGRPIGSHLGYPDPEAPPGVETGKRVCYRCHRLATRGHVPPGVGEQMADARRSAPRFILYRLGAVLVAGITFLVVSRTHQASHFLFGLAGVIVMLTLGRAARPRGRRATRARDDADADPRSVDSAEGR